jgi:prevent-host-death family protein
MDKTISAAEANRNFSRILREVREGRTYVVTSHGTAVAKIVPADAEDRSREAARKILFDRLRTQKPMYAGKFNRRELYEEE